MSRKILGLDIRYNAVSAVIVRGGIKGNWIEDHRCIPVSTDRPDASLSHALKTIAEEMEVDGATCIAAFPAEYASYRNIEAPFKNKKKLRQILPFELESTLPYSPENVIIDFGVLDGLRDAEHYKIFAAAAQKERVGFYIDLLKSHGMEPEVLTIGGYPLARALDNFSNDGENRLLIAVEPDRATLFLLLAGQINLVRSFSVSLGSANGIQHLCANVHQALSGFQKHMGVNIDIHEAMLTGSALEDFDVESGIGGAFDFPVRTMDLIALSGLVSIDTEGLLWRITAMDASLALALTEIVGFDLLNFRQGRFAVEKEWVEYKKDIIKSGLLAFLVLLLFFSNFVVDYFSMKKRSIRLEQEIRENFISTFPDVKRIVDPLQQMRVKLQDVKNADTFSAGMGRPVKTIDILNDISRFIPDQIDVELVSIIIGSDNVLISGDTGGFDAVDDVKNSLEQATIFKNVSITSTNKERSGNRVRFKIKAVI
ncbi:MAG: pilus assembly protein PilM [Deltaproteobacteria bacterium]|nr:pilus assembly protein PilM [Deltaproteobacteria bacterium]MBW2175525.1 pilus assembly protein PilM [Deltaproteobacteria bacterium]